MAQSSFARDCKDTCGTIFKIEPNGLFTTLHTFTGPDGQHPIGTLVLGKDGNFYGTTYYGGAGTGGTIFKISPSGDLTTLHSFQFADGMHPTAALTLATDVNFYGLTPYGGNHDCFRGCGTFFRMTPSGKFSVLHSFVPHTDGSTSTTGVVQAPDGNFYGSNSADALNQSGTVFRLTPSGDLTVLQVLTYYGLSFLSTPVVGPDGYLYGVSAYGDSAQVTCYDRGCGILYRFTTAGDFSILHNFCLKERCADGIPGFDYYGSVPTPTQSTDGIFYGVTYDGGIEQCHNINGTHGCGTIHSLSRGFAPFVKVVPSWGAAGATVTVLGTNLTGATSVRFSGAEAEFTVVSKTEISATVTAGATTGKVEVTTPNGTLSTHVPVEVQ